MSKQFPSHLDPDSFGVADFEDPYEAFYWLGYFAGRTRTVAAATDPLPMCTDEVAAQPKMDTVPDEVEVADFEAKCSMSQPGVPLRELADFCVFDTETSGLSGKDCAVQVAIGFFRKDGTPLGFYNKLWKLPPDVKLSPAAVRVHKITASMLEKEGLDPVGELREVHKIFSAMQRRGKKLVAHNASFDTRILRQTAARHGFDAWALGADDVFCTMQSGKAFCGLLSAKTQRPKAPSNSELYEILSGNKPDGPLHDAVFDVKVTARSFVLGAAKGWWSL